jgi:hypothetical protein
MMSDAMFSPLEQAELSDAFTFGDFLGSSAMAAPGRVAFGEGSDFIPHLSIIFRRRQYEPPEQSDTPKNLPKNFIGPAGLQPFAFWRQVFEKEWAFDGRASLPITSAFRTPLHGFAFDCMGMFQAGDVESARRQNRRDRRQRDNDLFHKRFLRIWL